MTTVDVAIIGGGHNALVAAAYLAKAGRSVAVLEREDHAGGMLVTEELIAPGYVHDTLAGFHLFFVGSPVWADLGDDLGARGLSYVNTDVPSASVTHDGRASVMRRDIGETGAGLPDPDGAAYVAAFDEFLKVGPSVGALQSAELTLGHAAGPALALLTGGASAADDLELQQRLLLSARQLLTSRFTGPEVPALLGPWVNHTGMTIDQAGSGLGALGFATTVHMAGMPIAVGGSARLVDALVRLVTDHGGTVTTGADVRQIVVEGGRAVGVRTADGEVRARHAVIASTTPGQLYTRLLPDGVAPSRAVEQARRFRYGRSNMQIHLALRAPLDWIDPVLATSPIVNVTDGLDAQSLHNGETQGGLLPRDPTFTLGVPTLLDPSRAPAGGSVVWIQLLETPAHPRGDAAGEIAVPDGWTDDVADAYADRVLDRLRTHVRNLDDALVGRSLVTPPQLQARNVNAEQGDAYAGSTDLAQSWALRPLASYGSHRTPVDGLFHTGQSTFPGPGVNGASGRIVAADILTGTSTG